VTQEEDGVPAAVRDVVLSELSMVVLQPREVMSLDDHLVHTIHADADDLSFDFIPFVHEALRVRVSAAEWSNARTVGQVCALLALHYRQKAPSEQAAIEARLVTMRRSMDGGVAADSRARYCFGLLPLPYPPWRPGYRPPPHARRRRRWRLWRSWQPGARSLRRALREGPMFKPDPNAERLALADQSDPAFVLARDVVFWVVEHFLARPRQTLSLDDDITEEPYIESKDLQDWFVVNVENLLEVSVSQREWSSAGTIRAVCRILARHFRAKPAHERQAIEAELRAVNVDAYNPPPPVRWWQFWRWELPRWPV